METNPKRKALRINLDETIYGAFAEIGAGQDVARRFFEAGAASGTIAKTISAYDMTVSDTIYGKDIKRYVSIERLQQMLKIEYENIVSLLKNKRSKNTRYFAFADTVAAINFKKDNEQHGWMGMRFQLKPDGEPCEVLLHVRMKENDYYLQQRTIGILGVNLIYACYNYFNEPVKFIKSLMDYLSADQIEIDMMEFCSDTLCIDNRLLSVLLVKHGLTRVAMFDKNQNVMQPADLLYKKDVLLLRGSFRPPTYVAFDMLKSGSAEFKKDIEFKKENYTVLCELTLDNIITEEGEFDPMDYLNRMDLLCGMGVNVMISNYRETYKLISYFNHLKLNRLGIVVGILTLEDIFKEKYYIDLSGGLFEALGMLFPRNASMYIYPALAEDNKSIIDSTILQKTKKLEMLVNYLFETGKIKDIKNVRKDKLHIFSREVYRMISNNEPGWEKLVPKFISKQILEKWMFRYREKPKMPDIGTFNF